MKKFLKSTALVCSVLAFSNALANTTNPYYAKLNIGASHFTNSTKLPSVPDSQTTTRSADESKGYVGVGLGYQLCEKFRTDITYTIHSKAQRKLSYSLNSQTESGDVTFKAEQFSTLMLGGYANIAKFGEMTIFAGGKIGIAMIKEKAVANVTQIKTTQRTLNIGGIIFPATVTTTTKIRQSINKNFINPAGGVLIGGSYSLRDNAHLDISVGFDYYGKSKNKLSVGSFTSNKTQYNTAYADMGLRFHF